jgi:hypothetical protein
LAAFTINIAESNIRYRQVEPLLIVRRTLREQIGILHGRPLAVVRTDDVCRRLMTVLDGSEPRWK